MAVIAKQRYKLDIAPNGRWGIIYASQHDDEAREIEFEITNQGNAFSIPASINVSVQGIKSNESYFSHSCSYSGNIVTMALADDMTDIVGKAICVLKFTNSSNQKLATAKFILNVDTDSSSEGVIIDTEAEEIFNQMLNDIRAQAASISADIAELQSMVGSPLVASTASAMTDHNKIYVYTGSESGYTNGNWYYWNGSAWTSGGVYNSTAFETDKTLSVENMAADAKFAGDAKNETDKNLIFVAKNDDVVSNVIFTADDDNSDTYNRHLFGEFSFVAGKMYCVTIEFSDVSFRNRANDVVFKLSTASQQSYNYLVDNIVTIYDSASKRKISIFFEATNMASYLYLYCYTALNSSINITTSIEEVYNVRKLDKNIKYAFNNFEPTWFTGGSINKNNGTFSTQTDTAWEYTQFYKIPENVEKIKMSAYAGGSSAVIVFYNENAEFVVGYGGNSKDNRHLLEFDVPAGAYYVRFGNFKKANYHLETPLILFCIVKDDVVKYYNNILDSINVSWTKGIKLNGSYSSSDYRMCMVEPVPLDDIVRISLADNWRAWVSYYKNGSWVKDGKMAQYKGFVPESGYDIYISLAKRDGSAITDVELATASEKIAKILNVDGELHRRFNQFYPNWSSLSMFYKIGILGDSFASGSLHYVDGGGSETNYNLSWGQILARDIGATVTNYSKGGLSTSTWLTNAEFGLTKLLASEPEQLYICAFGINDWNDRSTYPIGTISDCNDDYSQNPSTFYGSYGKIIGNIKNHAPNAKIIILSVMRENERQLDPDIKIIAEHFDIPFIQVTDDDYFISDFYARSMYGNHPLAYGYAGITEAMKRLIVKCIMENTDYFETYYG